MKNKNIMKIISGVLSVLILSTTAASLPSDNQEKGLEKMEEYLRRAKIVAMDKYTESGRTEFWKILLDDGMEKRKGIFKYVDRRRPRFLPDSYKYELAAYKMNKLLGLNIVPPVIMTTIDDRPGSLQIVIEDCIKERERIRKGLEAENPEEYHNTLSDLKAFEFLIGEECGDVEDILVDCKSWKIWRIDFSEAFAPDYHLQSDCLILQCTPRMLEALRKLDKVLLLSSLQNWLNKDEINTLLERRDIILERLKSAK